MVRSHPKIYRRIASAQKACLTRREEAVAPDAVRQRRATTLGMFCGLTLLGCASNAIDGRFGDGF